jgi:type IV secretory pathway VirB2 component (pilin)
MKTKLFILVALALMLAPAVMAKDCSGFEDSEPDEYIKCTIDNVTNLVSIIGGAVAILALTVIGVMMLTTNDPSERDQLKERLKYVMIGLVIIVVAPQIVGMIIG